MHWLRILALKTDRIVEVISVEATKNIKIMDFECRLPDFFSNFTYRTVSKALLRTNQSMYAVFILEAHMISYPQEDIENENFQLSEHSTMCLIPKHLWRKAIAFVWFYIELAVVGVGQKYKQKYQRSTF